MTAPFDLPEKREIVNKLRVGSSVAAVMLSTVESEYF